ncbi:MAG: hypothetical protein HKO95_04070 [Rhodobacteraceae bacterium]|jgi:hypothetical protein|nr:hypothetical protein [Alphaproteobacteria bacterium]MBT8476359.1 hypothetical protein [Alphaproteobacteria bacterium]NNK65894.1 hypothetical protein [Paracoccaceae bacterium]
MTPIAQAAAIAILTLGTGAATVSVMTPDIPDMPVPDAAWSVGSALDGRAFAITATLEPSGEEDSDILRFENGAFLSEGCQEYCDFGWSDYRTWTKGDTVHFTATATCPTAPHKTVWHGTVTGDEITVEMSWTTRRWYWTHQIMGAGSGTALPATDGAVAG